MSGPGIAASATFAAIALFLLLNENRKDRAASLIDKTADVGLIASPAELGVPDAFDFERRRISDPNASSGEIDLSSRRRDLGVQTAQQVPAGPFGRRTNSFPNPPSALAQPTYRDATNYFPQTDPVGQPIPPLVAQARQPDRGTALIIDRGLMRHPAQAARGGAARQGNDSSFTPLRPEPPSLNSSLLPAGAMVPAVLETALNTSRPGIARALVTMDMRGPDGKEVLIAKGARIIGQYGSDVAPGQDRVLITWERLVLPDGRQIKIAAPATDRDGASGLQGKVHSNALGRFLSSIVRSALDIATFRAINRSGSGSIVLAIPDSARGAGQELMPTKQYQRHITVPAGAKLSVFVTQDIDFSKSMDSLGGGDR